MDTALEIGKTSAKGSFHLLIGVAGSTIIMAIGTLILASLLPVNYLGLYGMALIPSSMISFFRDWGVNYAMTQQIASLRATGKDSEIHDVIVSGIFFELITGAILSLVCFAIAQPLAVVLSPNDVSKLSMYIGIMSLSIFAGAIIAATGAIFTGFERMKLNSLNSILQAIVKTALGPLLIILGFGVLGAFYAALTSIISGAIVGLLIVYLVFFKPLRNSKVGKCNVKQILKPLLNYGLPLTISTIVTGVLPQIIVFTMAVYSGPSMMGNYYAAAYFSVLLTFISVPISIALFPAFSKLNVDKEPELLKSVFASSVKYTALFLVPATMLIITLSNPLINFLFPRDGLLHSLFAANSLPKFPYAPLFLSLTSIVNLFVLFGNFTSLTFQTGIGKTKQLMKQSIVSLLVGLPLAYFLVVYLNSIGGAFYAIIGGIVGILISTIPAGVWSIFWSWKNYKIKADFIISAKIFFASLIASAATFLVISFLSFPGYLLMFICGTAVFLIVFLASAPLIGAVNRSDISNFQLMFSNLGLISKILSVPLLFMKRMCKVNNTEDFFGGSHA